MMSKVNPQGFSTNNIRIEEGKATYQDLTLELYNKIAQEGEADALQILATQLSHNQDSNIRKEDYYADDKKETIVFQWRKEFPKAAKYFDEISNLHRRLIFTPIKNCLSNNSSLDRDDLEEVAEKNLWFAIPTYDANTGNKFSTYATTCIRNGLTKFIISKVNINAQELAKAQSLDADIKSKNGDELNRHSIIADTKQLTPLEQIILNERTELVDLIKNIAKSELLNENERFVLKKRFEAIGSTPQSKFLILRSRLNLPVSHQLEQPETLEQVSERLNLSRERIRQIEEKALKKIADFIESYDYRDSIKEFSPDGKSKEQKKTQRPLTLAIGIDLAKLDPEQRQILRLKIEGRTYAQIASTLDIKIPRVNKLLSQTYEILGINTRKHPDDEKYLKAPDSTLQYSEAWNNLSSYQRAVMFLHLTGSSNKQIAQALTFTITNVASLLSDARKKLGVDVWKAPEPYNTPPANWNITEAKWKSLSVLEQMVAWETLMHPRLHDKSVATKFKLQVSSVPTLRHRARSKLGIQLKKIPIRIRPSNANFDKAKDYAIPPKGFEALSKIWNRLTPRQQAVMFLDLEGKNPVEISTTLELTIGSVHSHKSNAMIVVAPILTPKPESSTLTKEQWQKLSFEQQKIVKARLEHPEWTAGRIANDLKKGASVVRTALHEASKKLGIKFGKRSKPQYNSPPLESITQQLWQKLQPRHLAVAWESLKHPDWGPLELISHLKIVKKTKDAAINFVKELRREAGKILNLKIEKQAPQEVLNPPANYENLQEAWQSLSRAEKTIMHAFLNSRDPLTGEAKSNSELAHQLGYKDSTQVAKCIRSGKKKLNL